MLNFSRAITELLRQIAKGRKLLSLIGPRLYSPRISQGTRAGVGLRTLGKLALELGEQRPIGREEKLGASGGERRVWRHRCTINGETGARQGFKYCAKRRIAYPVMGPRNTAEQDKWLTVEKSRIIKASAKLAPDIGCVHCVVREPEAVNSGISFAVARRVEILKLQSPVGRYPERWQNSISIPGLKSSAVALSPSICPTVFGLNCLIGMSEFAADRDR